MKKFKLTLFIYGIAIAYGLLFGDIYLKSLCFLSLVITISYWGDKVE